MSDIKDYFLIGDFHSAALVSKNASIDFLCLPRFDSPSIFAKLLDPAAGYFALETDGYTVESEYIKDTGIVEFLCSSEASSFSLHDFMVPQAKHAPDNRLLVRSLKGVRGEARIRFYFSPRANYGKDNLQRSESEKDGIVHPPSENKIEPGLVLKNGNEVLILYLPSDAEIIRGNAGYEIIIPLSENQTKQIVMEYAEHIDQSGIREKNLEERTENFWRRWVNEGTYFNFHRDELVRSAITLKLMQYYPTGALVAAPTTSLPEELGSVRNWDYRYTWIRDATFTLYAFFILGHRKEAEKFFRFIHSVLERCFEENAPVSLMYTITGEHVPDEKTLDYLCGYKDSKPVRTGNDAAEQFQLDMYAVLIDAHYFSFKHYGERPEIRLVMQLVDKIESHWQKPGRGIWEVRSGDEHFTYSKVMAWVGADRAAKIAEMLKETGHAKRCAALANDIKSWIWDHCYNPEKKILKQHPDTDQQDATNFLFVMVQFLDKHDPKTWDILENTCTELCYKDIFVYRYKDPEGLPRGEGSFLLCSFWQISAWAIMEDTSRSRAQFEALERYMNATHLISEEINPDTGEYLGNYPQAFSHLGFIMSAYYIQRYLKKQRNRESE